MSETTTSPASYALLVTSEQGMISKYPLQPGRSVVMGSSPHCGIQISGKDVASMHCLIDLNEGVLGIQDWASPTGTLVNGTAITSRMTICENDQVKIGSVTISIRRTGNSYPKSEPQSTLSIEQDLSNCSEPNPPCETDVDFEDTNRVELDVAATTSDSHSLGAPEQDSPDQQSAADVYDWSSGLDDPADAQTAGEPWNAADDLDQYDVETVELLKAEIDDLRSMLAERDSQVDELSRSTAFDDAEFHDEHPDQNSPALQRRVDELIAEASEYDERVQILQDLLQATELKNQAEGEERLALEAWVGEIEHRIAQRETEWKAEIESVREQLASTETERNQLQHKLAEVASLFGAKRVYRETLDKLQTQNATLHQQLEEARKQAAKLKQQLKNAQDRESDVIQQERAVIAKERASVSRMQFELSRKLSEFEQPIEPKDAADHAIDLRVRALRSHLREIHEQEKRNRDERGESLFARISGMWKKMDEF